MEKKGEGCRTTATNFHDNFVNTLFLVSVKRADSPCSLRNIYDESHVRLAPRPPTMVRVTGNEIRDTGNVKARDIGNKLKIFSKKLSFIKTPRRPVVRALFFPRRRRALRHRRRRQPDRGPAVSKLVRMWYVRPAPETATPMVRPTPLQRLVPVDISASRLANEIRSNRQTRRTDSLLIDRVSRTNEKSLFAKIRDSQTAQCRF